MKKSTHSNQAPATATAPVAAAVAEAATKTSVNHAPVSIENLVAALSDPKTRNSTRDILSKRIEERQAELNQLVQARRALDEPAPAPSPSAAPASTPEPAKKRPGRPAASDGGDHATAIIGALKGEKNGLNAGELRTKLTSQGHDIDSKILASYLWNMSNKSQIQKSGSRGNFRYKSV